MKEPCYTRNVFKRLLADLSKFKDYELLKQSTLLEKGFEITYQHNRDLSAFMRLFFEELRQKNGVGEYKKVRDFFEDLTSIFLPKDGNVLTSKNMVNRASQIVSEEGNKEKCANLRKIILEAKIKENEMLK